MPIFRKKPVKIEAVHWNGENFEEIKQFSNATIIPDIRDSSKLIIPTLEGDLYASLGDWIIKGIQGEFYACKPDIFIDTYEPVDN